MQCLFPRLLYPFFLLIGYVVAPGINREEKTQEDAEYNIEGSSPEVARLHEYYRYTKKVMMILDQDPEFIKRNIEQASAHQIREGFLTNGLMTLLRSDTVEKLNRLKVEEIEHQKQLLDDNKEHMKDKESNEWNPIHHEEKDQTSFTQDDLNKLMKRYDGIQTAADEIRKKRFKEHEMKKELNFRKELKNMTEEQRAEAQKTHNEEKEKHKSHEKMHAPGHKAQMEEVWEEQDGLDADSFDLRTLFNLHDKDSNGYLDTFELETLFLSDLDKLYNVSDPHMDPVERHEEMQRMREMTMKEMDVNNDGLVSFKEYMDVPLRDNYADDLEWNPIIDEDQFSEEELMKYEEEEEEEPDFEEEEED